MRNEKNITICALAVIAVALLAMNQIMLYNINSRPLGNTAAHAQASQIKATTGQTATGQAVNNEEMIKAVEAIIPKGIPPVYGNELGVSFDKPVESLNILAALDGDLYPNGKLKVSDLNSNQKSRYLKIGASIACEYCCGATTLVFNDGKPACGCAHSAAMRGLAKYLLINHEDMTDEQILDQLVKWKTMFFPRQMIQKYMQQGGLTSTEAALPEMIGGC